MRPNRENQKISIAAALSSVLISMCLNSPVSATEVLDNGIDEPETNQKAPSTVPNRLSDDEPESKDSIGAQSLRTPQGRHVQANPGRSFGSVPSFQTPFTETVPSSPSAQTPMTVAVPPSASEQTYSIRLPLGVAGSVLPRLESGRPGQPPSSPVMPGSRSSASQDFSRPVAWRATAEAIRSQTAGPALQIATLASDFKTAYTIISQEAPAAGWNLTSFSLPAGHFLVRIPKSNESDNPDDAAAWLILLLSPLDAGTTEVRAKIQSRRPSVYAPAVSTFLRHCQLKATASQLL